MSRSQKSMQNYLAFRETLVSLFIKLSQCLEPYAFLISLLPTAILDLFYLFYELSEEYFLL